MLESVEVKISGSMTSTTSKVSKLLSLRDSFGRVYNALTALVTYMFDKLVLGYLKDAKRRSIRTLLDHDGLK